MLRNKMWDEEADVIVVGYGLSGAVAAIEAHDCGTKVIILEKSQYPGGCSILSGGMCLSARDADNAAKYLTETSGGMVDDNLIYSFAQELAGNEEYIRKLAQPYNATLRTTKAYEPGKKDEWGYVPLGYPFPGYETFYRSAIATVPGFKGFPWVQSHYPAGVNLMKVVMDHVEERPIKVMLSTPATRLVQDDEGAIRGVLADKEGGEIALKGRRAVILASAGFEQNKWLVMQYLQGKPFYSMAPLTHTGDGIIMAQKVGAALWHMWHVHGSYGFKFDEFPIAFRHPIGGTRNPKRTMPWIVVDKFGARYMNEFQPAPQDTQHRAMEVYDPDMPGYSRIPSYMIFDEAGRKHGPIAQPLAIGGYLYNWSRDNMQEVDKGWILKADSIPELALMIRKTKDSEARMDPETLEATVSQWNNIVKKGQDPLHRPPGTMMPTEVPPFYAATVWPIISNTQGGPQHNAEQQIIDAFGKPIPRLYATCELGSFWSHLYLIAGNLGECLSSGRVAGRKAAAETDW